MWIIPKHKRFSDARTSVRVDSATNRVDRLRLLGNGVVPQTAAKAWITLWEKMNELHPHKPSR